MSSTVIQSNQFVVPPEWPGEPPRPEALGRVLGRFGSWDGLTPKQKSKLVRDGGIVLARLAGKSHRQIAGAVDMAPSRVQEILGGA